MKFLVLCSLAMLAAVAGASVVNDQGVKDLAESGQDFLQDAVQNFNGVGDLTARFGFIPTILLLILWPVIFIVVLILLLLP